MVTKEKTYALAFAKKREERSQRQAKRQMMLKAAYCSQPKLEKAEDSLKALGAQLVSATLKGDTARLEEIRLKCRTLTLAKEEMLRKAGVPDEVPECALCGDTGYVNGKVCECIRAEANRIMVEELSHEMPLGDCRFDNFNLEYYADRTGKDGVNPRRRMTAVFGLCQDFAEHFSPDTHENLLFTGNTGLGKTHLTLAIVKTVVEKGYLAVYGSAENLFGAVESEKFSGEGRGSYDTILNCDLLVLDDLGAEMTTSFTKSVLYNIVNTRLLSRKPTVINTNLTMKEIESRYTARVSSRLIGNYNANRFVGNDIRQQKLLEKD